MIETVIFGIGILVGGIITDIVLYLTSAKGTYSFTPYRDEDGELDGVYTVNMKFLPDQNLLKKKRIILVKYSTHK